MKTTTTNLNEQVIRAAYDMLSTEPRDLVAIYDLRAQTRFELTPTEFDAAFEGLVLARKASPYPIENPRDITRAHREGGITLGITRHHVVSMR